MGNDEKYMRKQNDTLSRKALAHQEGKAYLERRKRGYAKKEGGGKAAGKARKGKRGKLGHTKRMSK